MKKSVFFDFLNDRDGIDFDNYLAESTEEVDYINWNQFVLPNDYGDAEAEYHAIRNSCALFDVSPICKYRMRGKSAGVFLNHLLTRPVSHAESMRGIYVIFCNEDGSRLYANIDNRKVVVGSINCSSWSWGLKRMIGNASIECQYGDIEELWTEMGNERLTVKLSIGPLLGLERRGRVPARIEVHQQA